ncbi:MAG: TIGR02996 domain-containing protein [Polyangiaceae bacterium]
MTDESLLARLEAARDQVKLDPKGTLSRLLEVFRVHPAAEVATAIRALGAYAAVGVTAPAAAKGKERQALWLAGMQGGDPALRGVLLAVLLETKSNEESLERLEALEPFVPDPRITDTIVSILDKPPYNAGASRTGRFWTRVFQLLSALGDPAIAPHLERWPLHWQSKARLTPTEAQTLAERLDRTRKRMALPAAPTLGERERAALASLVASLSSATSSSDDDLGRGLLEAVYADPGPDEPRAVYADWLVRRGDPWGELINLQLTQASASAPAGTASRVAELVAAHSRRILGPLYERVKRSSLTFERGFLDVCEPVQGVTNDPAWATVGTLVGAAPDARMKRLHTLIRQSNATLSALEKLDPPPPISTLQWMPDADPEAAEALFLRLYRAGKLAKLTKLYATPYPITRPANLALLGWLSKVAVFSQLEELGLSLAPDFVGEILAFLLALDSSPDSLPARVVITVGSWLTAKAFVCLERTSAGSRLLVLVGPRGEPDFERCWASVRAADFDVTVVGSAATITRLLPIVRASAPRSATALVRKPENPIAFLQV